MPFLLPLVVAAPMVVAVADTVPKLAIESTCRAVQPQSTGDKTAYQSCMKDETDARATLRKQWSGFDAAARQRCAEETTIGGYPSYVEVLTCLQMARDTAHPPAVGADGASAGAASSGAAGATGTTGATGAAGTMRLPRR